MRSPVVAGLLLRLGAASECVCDEAHPLCDQYGSCKNPHDNSFCWMLGCCNHGFNSRCSSNFPTPPPPSTPKTTTTTSTPANTCQEAYDAQCYNSEPFGQCCAVCSGGTSSFNCGWFFRDRVSECESCGSIIDGNFSWTEENEGVCENACGSLGRQGNHFLDYCPGGRVWQAVQACPGASSSLATAVPVSMCPVFSGAESCHWEHTKTTMNDDQTQTRHTLQGQFSFNAGDQACKELCVTLGRSTNAASDYCPVGRVGRALGSCPAAGQSVRDALEQHSEWCAASTQTLLADVGSTVKNTKLDSATNASAPRRLTSTVSPKCQAAWDAKCYDTSDDWKHCCHDCHPLPNARQRCTWNYKAPAGARINGSFEYPPEQQPDTPCGNVCGMLAHAQLPGEFCPGGSIYTAADHCVIAQHSLTEATAHTPFCTPSLLAQLAQLQPPVWSVCAGVAALAAFATAFARTRRRGDLTEELLGTQ